MTIPNRTCARIVGMYQGGMKGVKIADQAIQRRWKFQEPYT
jgi:hypothetical protein